MPTPKTLLKPQERPEAHWSRVRKIIAGLAGVAITAFGLATGAVVFLPRVTVDSGGQIDPSHPSPIPFTIANNGIIPLTNVRPLIGLCGISTFPPQTFVDSCNGPLKTKLEPLFWIVKRLDMDEKYTIRLDDAYRVGPPAKFGGASISIIVRYEPWFLPIDREKEFRFTTRLEDDGKLSWVSRPVDK